MLGSELKERFHGATGSNPLEGIEPMDLIQAVIDELWAGEIPEKLVLAAPYITTLSGVLAYSFDAVNEDDLDQLVPGLESIRRIRGIYRPAASGISTSDYNYQRFPSGDQNILAQRTYEGGLQIDNELRTLTFTEDPGAYTDRWKLDYYPKAPLVAESSRVPVLHGWELPMVLPGMRAIFEEWTMGFSEKWRPLFDKKQIEYRSILRNENNLLTLGPDLYATGDPVVEAQ